MRWLRLCGLIVGLAVWVRPVPGIAAGPADGPGCVGIMAEECVRWLKATMVLNENLVGQSMARRHQTDVNGKPLGGGLVTVYGRLPERMDQFVILLHLRPDDSVLRVESNLLTDLIDAHTEQGYDHSGLYEIVWRLIGRRCPAIAKLELYRFVENSVLPRLKTERQDFTGGLFGLHRVHMHAAGVPYCGVSFGYTTQLEWRGSADPRAGRSKKTFSSIELQ
jgi:hypothetical protein